MTEQTVPEPVVVETSEPVKYYKLKTVGFDARFPNQNQVLILNCRPKIVGKIMSTISNVLKLKEKKSLLVYNSKSLTIHCVHPNGYSVTLSRLKNGTKRENLGSFQDWLNVNMILIIK
jgi:hypothetical protein